MRNALDSSINTYENALTYEFVKKEGIDFIITDNVIDIKNSTNTIYSPTEAIEIIISLK